MLPSRHDAPAARGPSGRNGGCSGRAATRRRPTLCALRDERGSAVVEFVFLGVLLLVPVVYLVLTIGQLQGGSFAVVGAVDQAAKVYVDAPTPQEADARAREAVRIALGDFGFAEEQAAMDIVCSAQCLEPGSSVTIVVRLDVPFPLVPSIAGSHPSAVTVDATATQIVERFG
ncbi:Flp pilus assembly protein TadG [Arthrobacter sp. PL16]|nr:Flp pilus assembly protein TadG [Arthrobacter sp. PL16]